MYIWAQLEMGNMDCWVPCCYDSRNAAKTNGFGVKAPTVLCIAINGYRISVYCESEARIFSGAAPLGGEMCTERGDM